MKNLVIVFFSALALLLSSCNKEGKGGSASIEGKIKIEYIKVSAAGYTPIDTIDAQDERVYIIYGDNSTYNDDVRTSYNGNYKFDFLYKGDYKIYVYSECVFNTDTCVSETKVIIEDVTISSSNGATTVPDITIEKYIN